MTGPAPLPGPIPGGAADPRGWPLRQAVTLADLGELAPSIAEHGGQAVAIRPLREHPGWLAKLYRQPRPEEAVRLDQLVTAPATLSAQDRDALYAGACWPAARIFEPGNPAIGCVIPTAPEHFRRELRRAAVSVNRFVEIDWLAKAEDSIARVGLPRPSTGERLSACLNLARLAVVLERLGLVYSDWSYSNAFWSPGTGAVYLIDVDGCQPGKMPDIHQPGWEDPLTPRGADADRYTDRYRLALLTARCLTGRRDAGAFHAMAGPWPNQPALGEALHDMLFAADRERRPAVDQLHRALAGGPYLRLVPRPAYLPVPPAPVAAVLPRPAPLAPASSQLKNPHVKNTAKPVKAPKPPKPVAQQGSAMGRQARSVAAVVVLILAAFLALVLVSH